MNDQNREKKKKTPAGKVVTFLGILFVLIPVLAAAVLLVPRIAGYEEYVISSGSMEPDYPVGSLIFVEDKEPHQIGVGEVMTFRSSGGESVVTHRVVRNDTAKGEIITKGDANKENDFLPVKYEKVIGVVVNCIPKAGFAAGLARDMKGIILIVSMIGAGFALLIAATYMKK